MLTLLVVVLVVLCAFGEAKKTATICCAQLAKGGHISCISNATFDQCDRSKSLFDEKTSDCCKTTMFACTEFLIMVNNEPVESTCESPQVSAATK